MGKELRGLACSRHSEWFGPGPLALAVWAGVRAVVATEPFARWAWTVVAVLMLALCAVHVVWTTRSRR